MTTTATVAGVDFVSVPTQDLDRATEFYENVVGLTPGPRWQRPGHPAMGAEFETGGVTLAVIVTEALGIEFSPHRVPIALHVNDVEVARAELEARGVEFLGGDDRQRCVPAGAVSGSGWKRTRPASPVCAARRPRLTSSPPRRAPIRRPAEAGRPRARPRRGARELDKGIASPRARRLSQGGGGCTSRSPLFGSVIGSRAQTHPTLPRLRLPGGGVKPPPAAPTPRPRARRGRSSGRPARAAAIARPASARAPTGPRRRSPPTRRTRRGRGRSGRSTSGPASTKRPNQSKPSARTNRAVRGAIAGAVRMCRTAAAAGSGVRRAARSGVAARSCHERLASARQGRQTASLAPNSSARAMGEPQTLQDVPLSSRVAAPGRPFQIVIVNLLARNDTLRFSN